MMIRIALLFCLLTPLWVCSQAPLYWSPPFEVAPSNFHNLRPQVELVFGDTPLVLWGSTVGGRKGWLARWNGNGFDMPQRANPNGSINAYTVEGPNLAARGDTAYLVYTTAPSQAAKVMLRSSFDGGQTWNPPVWVDSLGTDLPTFPNIAIGPGGQPILLYMRQQSNYENPRYVVHTSTDAGQSWRPQVDASAPAPGGEVCDCCTAKLYPTPDKLVTLFRNNDNNLRDIWATWSTDGGASFTHGMDVDTTDWTLPACPSSGPEGHVAGDSLFSVFMSNGSGEQRIFLSAAHLDSQAIAYHRQLDPGVGQNAEQNFPAVAGKGDTIGVVWAFTDGNSSAIYMNYSFSGPAGLFSQPAFSVVNGIAGMHDYPDIAFNQGAFHIVWANQTLSRVMYRRLSVDSFVVGLPSMAAPVGLQIVPNPVQTAAEIRWNWPGGADLTLQVWNAQGQQIAAWKAEKSGKKIWMRENWPAGLYFLRLKSPEGREKTLRFLVN